MNPLVEAILTTFKGVDNEGSSKRITLFWIAGPIWGFVNVVVFLFYKKLGLPVDLPSSLVFYDFLLIGGLAGLTVLERYSNKALDVKKEVETTKAVSETL